LVAALQPESTTATDGMERSLSAIPAIEELSTLQEDGRGDSLAATVIRCER
jgi:hypothetical protein